MNKIEQTMSHIFCKRRYKITNEHMEVLGQFLGYTGMDVKKLKECLTKGYMQMFTEAINKGIEQVLDT